MHIRRNFYFVNIIFSCLSSTKPCLRFPLISFTWEIKGFNPSSLENEVDFTDIMNVSPNILAKNWNFRKLRRRFVDERAMIATTLTSSCHCKTLLPFCLRNKRPEKEFLTLTVSYCKIVQKNKLSFKTAVNWLFNDIWRFLVIACIEWKIGVFQQIVVRVYYILNLVTKKFKFVSKCFIFDWAKIYS